MKMAQTEKLLVSSTEYVLEKINYENVQLPGERQLQVNVAQGGELVGCTKEVVTIRVESETTFDPDEYFHLKIAVLAYLYLDPRTYENLSTENKIREYVAANMPEILGKLAVWPGLSLLISQISSSFGKVPIILPPAYRPDQGKG